MAYKVDSVVGVWATVLGGDLVIYTLIDRKGYKHDEKSLHEIESYLLRKWPDVPIEFEIFRDGAPLKEKIAGIEPILGGL
jgi:hypothetical protein